MQHRYLKDIFPPYYPSVPDERDMEKLCRAHFQTSQTPDDLTRWIYHQTCPYLREAYAESMYTLIQNNTDDDTDFHVNAAIREEVDAALNKIIRCARTDQLAEEMYIREQPTSPSPLPTATPIAHEHAMEAQLQYLTQEVEQLKQEIRGMQPHSTLMWPTYAPGIEDIDKHAFEKYLRELCTSTSKSATHDIKNYLELKARNHTIIRPSQLKDEYTILQRFGYTKSEKTYYNRQ